MHEEPVITPEDIRATLEPLGLARRLNAEAVAAFVEAANVQLERDLTRDVSSISSISLDTTSPALEAEAMSLHAVALTSRPAILYWSPATVRLLQQVPRWRQAGLAVYFTLDAGPNVHLLCEAHHADDLARELAAMGEVERYLVNHPAPGARLLGQQPAAERAPAM